jgi:hypothetical protein
VGLLLLVEEILHVDFRGLQLLNPGLKLCNQQRLRCQTTVEYFQ